MWSQDASEDKGGWMEKDGVCQYCTWDGRALNIGATTIDLGRLFECLLSLAAFEVKGRSVFATDYTVWHSIILGLLFR